MHRGGKAALPGGHDHDEMFKHVGLMHILKGLVIRHNPKKVGYCFPTQPLDTFVGQEIPHA